MFSKSKLNKMMIIPPVLLQWYYNIILKSFNLTKNFFFYRYSKLNHANANANKQMIKPFILLTQFMQKKVKQNFSSQFKIQIFFHSKLKRITTGTEKINCWKIVFPKSVPESPKKKKLRNFNFVSRFWYPGNH